MSIFISHAAADEPLVSSFVDLLRLGLDISAKSIFCTSLEGMGIPQGSYFVQFIQERLKEAKFVIALVTPQYYESAFCMCELGATWILEGQEFFPILVPPLEYEDLKAVLYGAQSGALDEKRTLNALCDRLEQAGVGKRPATGQWEQKRDEFLKAVPRLLSELSGPSKVGFDKFEILERKYNLALENIEKKNAELAEVKNIVEELKQCKDAEEVKEVVRTHSSTYQEFEVLVEGVKKSTRKLPSSVVEALFYESSGREWRPRRGFGTEDIWEPIEAAEEKDYLDISEDGLVTVRDHPKVERAKDRLLELAEFIESEECDNIRSSFEEENDFPLNLSNRDFWSQFMGVIY